MRLSTDRRRSVVLAAVALIFLPGCKDRSGPGTGTETTGTGAGNIGAAGGPTVRQAADAFLKDLGEGHVRPDQLTTRFQKQLTPPGRDPWQANGEWLEQFKGATFVVGEEAKAGDATAFRGLAKFPDRSMAFAFRLVNNSDGNQADWLHLSERQGSDIKAPGDPNLAAAQDTVRNFLDVLLGGDQRQAHILMTLDWKKELAPAPPPEARKGAAYDSGFLTQTTRSWKRDFLGYSLSTGDLGPNKDTATFIASMDSGPSKTPYVVKAAKDKVTGEWLVTEFHKQ